MYGWVLFLKKNLLSGIQNGENGFLYRFEEYDIASSYIEKIFEDDSLAEKLSVNAREEMLKLHANNNVFERMAEIYNSISEGK